MEDRDIERDQVTPDRGVKTGCIELAAQERGHWAIAVRVGSPGLPPSSTRIAEASAIAPPPPLARMRHRRRKVGTAVKSARLASVAPAARRFVRSLGCGPHHRLQSTLRRTIRLVRPDNQQVEILGESPDDTQLLQARSALEHDFARVGQR